MIKVSTDKLAVLVLDGECEVMIHSQDRVEIELCRNGPCVVKIKEVLEEAVGKGFFTSSKVPAL